MRHHQLSVSLLLLSVAACHAADLFAQDLGPVLERVESKRWVYAASVMLSTEPCESQIDDEFIKNDGPATGDKVVIYPLVIRRGMIPWVPDPDAKPLVRIDMSPASRVRLQAETASFIWPVAERSASHDADIAEGMSAELWIDQTQHPLRRRLFTAYADGSPLHSGAAWADWYTGRIDTSANTLELRVRGEVVSSNTVFHEKTARRIGWPRGEWPSEAAGTFEPMLLTDFDANGRPYDPEPIERLARELTKGRERSQPPVVAAKWIAGELAKRFQFDRSALEYCNIAADRFDRDQLPDTLGLAPSLGVPLGFNARGASDAARDIKGSPIDLPLLLIRVYRELGIPARLVVGFHAGRLGGLPDIAPASDEPELGLHVWVEFALMNESGSAIRPDQQLMWIPVDVLMLRAAGSHSRSLDEPWRGFGTIDYLNQVIPFGFHLAPHRMGEIWYGGSVATTHPEQSIGSGRPAYSGPRPLLYGINIVPHTPSSLTQGLLISAWEAPVTSGQNHTGR